MTQFEFGPIELYLIGLGEEGFSPRVLESLNDLVNRGIVRLVDVVLVTKTAEDDVVFVELDDDVSGMTGLDLAALGIACEEDIQDLAQAMSVGQTAVLVVLELAWAKELAAGVAESGAVVLATERIPAPVVNVLAEALAEEVLEDLAEELAEEEASERFAEEGATE